MKGKIIKGISGFYYVHVAGSGVYECRAKGIFRNRKVKPLVGDEVEIDVLNEKEKEGSLVAIAERKNELIRPAVANIDQALLVFSVRDPVPNFHLLDRLLVTMRHQAIPVILCFNKADLSDGKEKGEIAELYKGCGSPVLFTSAARGEGTKELASLLEGKTSAASGPSGVGKSSLINAMQQEVCMETGEVSKKIGRGRHTTRHAQLIGIGEGGYIMDTPGFGSLDVLGISSAGLSRCYEEFLPFEQECRFRGCSHISEPDCGVRRALEEGRIHPGRYGTYAALYRELKEKETEHR